LSEQVAIDRTFMARCLELARRAEGRTAPNPIVGCVIARGERVIAEGFHRGPGTPHGEAAALAALGGRSARGTTLYVNLEPCMHVGRTPPCAPAVLAAGVKRVVVGALDPIEGHGGGARWLARHGVAVQTGVLGEACGEANAAFFTWARHGRPRFVVKAAISLDGRIATARGESKWITGEAARREAHRLRDRLDAVMVGVGTVLADDPRLTVRGIRGGRDPIRVIVDGRLRTPPSAAVVRSRGARTIVACARGAAPARHRALSRAGVEVWQIDADREHRLDLHELARRLGRAGVTSVLVEGGAALHASVIDADLADELRLFVAPIVLGGRPGDGGPAWVGGDGVARLARAPRFAFVDPAGTRAGDDVVLVARRIGELRRKRDSRRGMR
jgi:diaminohydroxyphosphoribosylaminopyrimidine deaminase/5-amino-6-(5-phosphoribosylamino)uracil reductase